MEFKLTKEANPNNYEELGLHFTFYEKKIGQKSTFVVEALEEGNGVEVRDQTEFKSWDQMKKEYPTLKSLLVAFAHTEYFDANWRENERVVYIESIQGHEELYPVNKLIHYDYENEDPIVEFDENKYTTNAKSSPKKKKI